MALSDDDRAALRGHWLGEPLPERLAEVLGGTPSGAGDRAYRSELRGYLRGLSGDASRQTRRLVLTYGPAAVARLVELMQGDSAETARRAAVDLLRHWESSAREEQAEAAQQAADDDRRLAENLTDEQARQLLAILADAGDRTPARAGDPGDPEERDASDD